MKLPLIISVCAGLVLGNALGNAVWADPAIQVPADVYAFEGGPCGSDLLDVSIIGNKTRLKLHNFGSVVSEDPRLTGWATVDVEVTIHNVNGHINAHGSLLLEPTGYAGTWEADFNIQAPGGQLIDLNGIMIVKDSQINARGSGVFAGQWYFFAHGLAVPPPPYDIPVEDPDGPGGCEFAGEIWTGRILNPNAGQ